MKILLGILLSCLVIDFSNSQEIDDDDVEEMIGTDEEEFIRQISLKNLNNDSTFYRNKGSVEAEFLSSCRRCGLATGSKKSIFGGDVVKPPFKYPWMVSVIIKTADQRGGNYFCGGAIINKYWILSAAHCFERNSGGFYDHRATTVNLVTGKNKERPGPPADKVILHPKYDRSNQKHDICLIKLRSGITCSKYNNPICLPKLKTPVRPGMEFTIAGWGSESIEGGTSKKLKEAQVTFINMCNKNSYCLRGTNRKQTPCTGDSGGPMFSEKNGLFYVFGVASAHTSKTCNPNDIFQYTSVPKHIQWINRVMKSSSSIKIREENGDRGRKCPRKCRNESG